MSRHHSGRPAAAGALSVLTHNVGGLSSLPKLLALLRAWSWQGVHLVCVQETWIGHQDGCSQSQFLLWLQQAADALAIPIPEVWLCNNTLADGHRAGVAVILLRQPAGHHLQVQSLRSSPDGRCLTCAVHWAGHSLHLLTLYWPNVRAEQRRFFLEVVLPALAPLPAAARLLLAGDFNYVPDAARDRTPLPDGAAWNDDRVAERDLSALVHQRLHHARRPVADVFRALHPTTRGYTRITPSSSARLDRFLASPTLTPHLRTCRVTAASQSDHLPLLLTLLPAAPSGLRGRGRWRAQLSFLQVPALRAALAQWIGRQTVFALALDDGSLLDWWPRLKLGYRNLLTDLHLQYLATRAAVPDVALARRTLEEALSDLHGAAPEQRGPALQAALDARTALAAAEGPELGGMAREQRVGWVHQYEAPGPALTRLLRPPTTGTGPAALTGPDGALVTDPARMADMLVQHFAQISAPRPVQRAAQEQVFAAMHREQQAGTARRMHPREADAAGSSEVSADEVRGALQLMKRRKSPGPDGIPSELWKQGVGDWVPLFARLFTCMARCQRLPAHFSLGSITALHKGGDASVPGNYRPITLLNADYKLLARVLATRFRTAMADSIGAEQTAFLAGRQISDGIHVAQLLPAALAAAGAAGGVILLDIAKAYDTVDRGFLLQAMAAHGAGEGMVAWVDLLLQGTVASTCVRGHSSRPQAWHAGVRQGCPLSPLLYLFVGEALACWLRSHPALGVVVGGRRFTSVHFADDAKIYLTDLSQELVAALFGHLRVFEGASGQVAHMAKSCGVPLGTLSLDAPGTTRDVPVQPSAKSLGVVVAPVPVPALQLTRPGLRTTVRDPAPQPPRVSPAWTARLRSLGVMCGMVGGLPLSTMGRGLAVSSYALSTVLFHAEFEGLPLPVEQQVQDALARAVDRPGGGVRGLSTSLLTGPPARGGFGVLPVGPHVCARHAKHASRLLRSLCGQPAEPWHLLAQQLLRVICPRLHPVQTLLLAAFATPAHAAQGRLTGVQDQRSLVPDGPLLRMVVALQRMGPLAYHPDRPGDRSLTPLQLLSTPAPDVLAMLAVAQRLVWASQVAVTDEDALGPCAAVTVKGATLVQLSRAASQRALAHRAYALQAFAHSPALAVGVQAARADSFARSLPRVWKIPWENTHKDTLWRLAVNGIPGAGGLDYVHRHPCVCGVHVTAAQQRAGDSSVHRLHAFWECPVARAVREQLSRGAPGVQVHAWNVWLLQPPPRAGLRPVVWRVVALAALEAMNDGRRYMWWHRQQAASDPAVSVQRACARAADLFALALHDFCAVNPGGAGKGWEAVGADHKFIALVDRRLVVTLPV